MGEVGFCAENIEDLRRQLREYIAEHGKKLVLRRVDVFGCEDGRTLYVFGVVE